MLKNTENKSPPVGVYTGIHRAFSAEELKAAQEMNLSRGLGSEMLQAFVQASVARTQENK